jgi:chromosomal replication initiator protein
MEIQHDGAGRVSPATGPVWPEAKRILAERLMPGALTPKLFKTWIDPLSFVKAGDGSVQIVSPNEFFHRYVTGHYRRIIEAALQEGAGREGVDDLKVSFSFSLRTPPPLIHREIMDDKFDVRPFSSLQPQRRGSGDILHRYAQSLNRSFTFANFVVGNPNRLAHSSARAFAEDPSMGTGILFLLSENGLGKSHLSQALAHLVLERSPRRNVLYVTAEHFTNLMTMSINSHSMDEFKRVFREQCDILMVEDVTFLSGKPKIQNELRSTLDTLLDRGRKIVLTGTLPPRHIPGLEKNLSSRMNSSLIAPIAAPDFDTRLKILDRKAAAEGIRLDRKVMELVADRVTSDVRLLESAVASIKASVMATRRPADLAMAAECVSSLPSGEGSGGVSLEAVKDYVCRTFSVDSAELNGKSRIKRHSDARKMGIYLSRRLTGKTLVEIGKFYGRRHSSALYTCNRMDMEYRNDPKVTRQVDFYIGELTRQR